MVGYFRKVAERLQVFTANGRAEARDTGGAGESEVRTDTQANGNVENKTALGGVDAQGLTARVEHEVESLQLVLFSIPTTSGGIPQAFLDCSEHTATLEEDGVEEVCHQSASASRSSRGGDQVVIAVDDDG